MFKNCQIISVSANPVEYHTIEPGKGRGTPAFVMSSSSLRSFWACPDKWVTPIVDLEGVVSFWEFEGSASTEYGALFDCLLLTPEQFRDRYAITPKEYVNDKREVKPWSGNANVCKQWKEDQEEEGRIITNDRELHKVNEAIKRFRKDPQFQAIVDASEKQVWVVGEWHDPSGLVIPCKCLIDLCPRKDSAFFKSIGDVKTTKNARIIPWEKWCHAAGYEIQAAWNWMMFVEASQREITTFRFLLSENEAPYTVGRRLMSADLLDPERDLGDIASGRRQIRRMLADYCSCLKTGRWPGYDDTDEAIDGWSVVTPNPYAEQARQFAPKLSFSEPGSDQPGETEGDVIP